MGLEDSQSEVNEFGLMFDEQAWPLLYIRFPAKGLNDESLEAFIERYDEYLDRREPFAAISDSRGVLKAINANQRKRMVVWFEKTWNVAKKYNVANAVLLKSAMVRGALTAVFWMKAPPGPTKAFGSVAEAAPWLRERLEAAGVTITPEMERVLSGRL